VDYAKSIEDIELRLHTLLQKRLQEGWCLKSSYTSPVGFVSFSDTFSFFPGTLSKRKNTACGCLVGVLVGDVGAPLLRYREVASKLTGVREEDLYVVECGFENWVSHVESTRASELYALGESIRETYNA
jgi:hypothetical protein